MPCLAPAGADWHNQAMERNEVSIHEARLYRALEAHAGTWKTSAELATAAQIAGRTSRAHVVKLHKLGLVDVAEVFPGHRYRLAQKADKRNASYVIRLRQAVEVFGLA